MLPVSYWGGDVFFCLRLKKTEDLGEGTVCSSSQGVENTECLDIVNFHRIGGNREGRGIHGNHPPGGP